MAPTAHEDLSERLLAQIDSLQENAAPLANAANLRELATRFTDQLSTAFRPGSIELLLHREGDRAWRVLPGGAGERPLAAIPLPEASKSVVGQIGANGSELTVVQRLSDKSHLAIRLCGPAQGDGFRRSDLLPVQLDAHLFDIGYKSLLSHTTEKGLIFSLNHRVLQLNSLIDTGIEVTKLEQEIPPHHLALQRAASLTNAAKGVVTVSSDGRGTEHYLFPAAAWEELKPREGLHITTSFTYGGSEYTFELFEKESRSGAVAFDETDQLLLDALARQVQGSLENQYLHAQALEKQKIEQDIAVAASIQQRILPTTLPAIDGYDIAGINLPSRMVGGDYFDCIRLPGGRFAFVVADVAGKGINAALLVSSLLCIPFGIPRTYRSASRGCRVSEPGCLPGLNERQVHHLPARPPGSGNRRDRVIERRAYSWLPPPRGRECARAQCGWGSFWDARHGLPVPERKGDFEPGRKASSVY